MIGDVLKAEKKLKNLLEKGNYTLACNALRGNDEDMLQKYLERSQLGPILNNSAIEKCATSILSKDNWAYELFDQKSGIIHLLGTRPHTTTGSNYKKLIDNYIRTNLQPDSGEDLANVPNLLENPQLAKNLKSYLTYKNDAVAQDNLETTNTKKTRPKSEPKNLDIHPTKHKSKNLYEKANSYRQSNRLKVLVAILLLKLLENNDGETNENNNMPVTGTTHAKTTKTGRQPDTDLETEEKNEYDEDNTFEKRNRYNDALSYVINSRIENTSAIVIQQSQLKLVIDYVQDRKDTLSADDTVPLYNQDSNATVKSLLTAGVVIYDNYITKDKMEWKVKNYGDWTMCVEDWCRKYNVKCPHKNMKVKIFVQIETNTRTNISLREYLKIWDLETYSIDGHMIKGKRSGDTGVPKPMQSPILTRPEMALQHPTGNHTDGENKINKDAGARLWMTTDKTKLPTRMRTDIETGEPYQEDTIPNDTAINANENNKSVYLLELKKNHPFDCDVRFKPLDIPPSAFTGIIDLYTNKKTGNDSLTVAEKLRTKIAKEKYDGDEPKVKILILNAASEITPGGGAASNKTGSQEESLCYGSALYMWLTAGNMDEFYQAKEGFDYSPYKYSISKNVPVYPRTENIGRTNPKTREKEDFYVAGLLPTEADASTLPTFDFISHASRNCSDTCGIQMPAKKIQEKPGTPEFLERQKREIDASATQMIKAAREGKYDGLVLCNLGAGAFANPTDLWAEAWAESIRKYGGDLYVSFAIFDGNDAHVVNTNKYNRQTCEKGKMISKIYKDTFSQYPETKPTIYC